MQIKCYRRCGLFRQQSRRRYVLSVKLLFGWSILNLKTVIMNPMIRKWAKKAILFGSALELIFIKCALAGTGPAAAPVTLPNPLGANSTFQTVVASVTQFLILIAIPLTTIMALVG